MSFNRFVLPYTFTVNGNGTPYENAYLIFFETDQVTQQTTYSDYLCTVPSTTVSIIYNTVPVVAIQANANGVFPTIFMPADKTYYWVLLDETLATLKTENQYSVPPVSTLSGNQFIDFMGNTYVGRKSIEIVGTTYVVDTVTSWGNVITFNNPNPIAVTLAAPSPTTFPDGWVTTFQNIGDGVVTITGGANINGVSTLVLNKSDGADVSSDGTRFNASTGAAELAYYNYGGLLTVTANAITINSSHHLIDTSGGAQTINTINGGAKNQLLVLQISDAANALTITAGAGIKLQSGTNVILNSLEGNIVLMYDLANSWWTEVSRGNAGGIFIDATNLLSTGLIQVAHGLNAVPNVWSVSIRCNDAGGDAGYAQNDEIKLDTFWYFNSVTNNGPTSFVNSTNIGVSIKAGIDVANKTSQAETGLTNSKWNIVFRASL